MVIEGVFRPDEMERVADAAVRIARSEQVGLRDKEYVDISEDGRVVTPRKLRDLFIKDPVFREFFVDPRLLQIVRALLGEEPLLLGDQTFLKPPRYGSNKPYHQDNFYFRCHPADHVVTTWVALDDVSISNGCLRYIDGSHRGGILPHDPIPGEPHNLVPPAELIDLTKRITSDRAEGWSGLPPFADLAHVSPERIRSLAPWCGGSLGDGKGHL